jgi:hypothetical protein
MKNPSSYLTADAKNPSFHLPHRTVNGFAPHNLTVEEARTLHYACYLTPLDMRLPTGWRLSVGGVGIPPICLAHRTRWWEEIHANHATLTKEERASPQWDPLNDLAWEAFFIIASGARAGGMTVASSRRHRRTTRGVIGGGAYQDARSRTSSTLRRPSPGETAATDPPTGLETGRLLEPRTHRNVGAEDNDLDVIDLEIFFLVLHTGHLAAGLLLVCPEARGQGRAQLAT